MKSLAIFLFTLSSFTQAYSQVLAPVGAEWHYSINQFGGSAPPNSEYARYYVAKDTLYKGFLAKKIERQYFRNAGDSVNWSTLYLIERNDTVLYYNDQYSRYIPLYIFNVTAGDTLRFYHSDTNASAITLADSTFRLIVDSVGIDTFSNSVTLKGIYTSPLDDETISGLASDLPYLEKIGSLSILLPRSTLTLEHDGPLRCYEDSQLFVNYSTKACDYRLTVGLNDVGLLHNSNKSQSYYRLFSNRNGKHTSNYCFNL